jgi:hypothetical protein
MLRDNERSQLVKADTPEATLLCCCFLLLPLLQLMHTGQLQPQSLCIVLHSIGRLTQQQQHQQQQQQQPVLPDMLLQELLEYAQPLLRSLPPAGLNMLSNALLLLKTDPSSSWHASFLQATFGAMRYCDARNASVLAVPLLRWKLAPSSSWLQQYLEVCEPLLQQMQPQVSCSAYVQSAAAIYMFFSFLLGYQTCPFASWYTAHTVCNIRHLQASHTMRFTLHCVLLLCNLRRAWQCLGMP